MRQGTAVTLAGVCAALFCAPMLAPTPASAQNAAADPATRLALMGAPFADSEAPPAATPDAPPRLTAMAFLPGRGVIAWDVTGKTPQQAREAQIEAMGLADARAVQREIDEAAAERASLAQAQAQAESGGSERAMVLASAQGPGAGLNRAPALGGAHQASAVVPLSRAARARNMLGVRNGEALKSQPRVYAFAAASGQAVGFNMTHDGGNWKTAGLTTDQGGFVGQRQAGLALRAGAAQASLSYVQQKTETQILGMERIKDHRLMLTLNLRPTAIAKLFTGGH